MMEEIGLWAGFILTLMIYSYIIRDNFLYRIAVYVFVGLAAGYISIVTFESVLIPWFDTTLGTGDPVNVGLGLVPVLLVFLLFFKSFPRLARLGNLAIAFLVGVGAAVALVGSLTGTLVPLSASTMQADGRNLIEGVLILVGVVTSLLYFQYLGRRPLPGEVGGRPGLIQTLRLVGQGFIVVTLGALYAAAILTSLTIFSERISFLLGQLGI